MKTKFALTTLTAAALSTLLAACGGGSDSVTAKPVAQLFAQTNDASNAVLTFVRNADGTLVPKGSVATGGKGTAGVNLSGTSPAAGPDALTSNHAVIVSSDKTRLFVANAGDNTVSTFAINPAGGITLLAVSATNGTVPNSLAYQNGVLYVTDQKGAQELGAYRVGTDGKLSAIGQYTVVAQDAVPTEVSVSPDGKFVVVNVKSANVLLAYPVNGDGSLGQPVSSASAGAGPFGGAFGSGSLSGIYVVTEAGGATTTAYALSTSGTFTPVSGPVAVAAGSAPCWISITPDNKFAYVSNGGGFVSLFSLDASGKLTLVNGNAAAEPAALATAASSAALDSWISPDGKYFYQDYAGDDKIVAYSIDANGGLTKLGEQAANTQSKVSLQGLAGT